MGFFIRLPSSFVRSGTGMDPARCKPDPLRASTTLPASRVTYGPGLVVASSSFVLHPHSEYLLGSSAKVYVPDLSTFVERQY